MRYHRLDAVRGLLALSIVWLHALGLCGPVPWWGHQQLAVNAFIVISGFLTALALTQRPRPYAEFLFDRCVRIFPVFWACLVVALVLHPLYWGSTHIVQLEAAEGRHFWLELLIRLPLLQGLVPRHFLPESDIALLPPAWFCSLVLQFSLVAPWIVRRLRGPSGITLFGLSLLILLDPIHWRAFAYWSGTGAFLPQKLYLFIAGGLLYTYWPTFGSGSAPKSLVWLGTISYPLFLVHFPILALVHAWLPASAWIIFAIGCPISIASAYVLHVAVERPCSRALAKKKELNYSVVVDARESNALDHPTSVSTIQA